MAITHIATNTITSNTASSVFTSGIDDTYKLYIFKFHDVKPETDGMEFQWQANVSGESGYNENITSTYWLARHQEAHASGAGTTFSYDPYINIFR